MFVDQRGQEASDLMTHSCWTSSSTWLLLKALVTYF